MGLSMDSARKPLMKTGFQRIFLSESSHGSTVTNFCIQILKKVLAFWRNLCYPEKAVA